MVMPAARQVDKAVRDTGYRPQAIDMPQVVGWFRQNGYSHDAGLGPAGHVGAARGWAGRALGVLLSLALVLAALAGCACM